MLLEANAAIDKGHKQGETPLAAACAKGHADLVRVLLAAQVTRLAVGLYTILPSPILESVWHKGGRRLGGRILRNRRVIVLQ